MENYKGIYYNDEKEPKLYEGGAHFKYNKLYKILLSLGGVLEDDDFNHSSIKYKKKEHIKSNKDINSLLIKVKGKKSKYKTRNIEDLIYDNNPNTQIRPHNTNITKKSLLSKKDHNSRNAKNGDLFHKKYSYFKKAITSTSINDLHYKKINNDLIKIILKKKEIDKKKQENNNINNKMYPILNYSRYIHNRNRSDGLSSNITNSTFHNNTQRVDINNKSEFKSIETKSGLTKKSLKVNTNDLSDVNGQEIYKTDTEKQKIKKKKYPLVYGKTKIRMLKASGKMNSQFSLHGNKKKTKNGVNKKTIDNNKTENNKNNNDINYKKKCVNNYFFNKKEKNKEDINITTNKTINNNNISSLNSNRFKDCNIKNKEKILKTNGNHLVLKKYIRKKVNQNCHFNHNNAKLQKISKSIDQI